jgi:uncharacterized metal-binding protein
MPSGKTHLRIELFLLPIFATLFYLFVNTSWAAVALFAGAYLFSSLMLSPDLDLRYNHTRRRWGLLGFIWIPYTKIFKHRGVSHSLLFGTLTRLGYLGLLAVLIIWGLSYFDLWPLPVAQLASGPIDLWLVGILVAGLWLPNILHTLVDHIHGLLPRRRHRRASG